MSGLMNQTVESLTGYQGVIGSDHAYIHKGLAFTATMTAGSISSAHNICFTTPTVASGKFVHWRPVGITTSANYVAIQLSEGETYSAGTAVTPINRNRLSSATSSMTLVSNGATCTPAGTVLLYSGIGTSGVPTARSGGGSGAAEELVLKQATKYCLTITPAGATTVNLDLFWYEESSGLAAS